MSLGENIGCETGSRTGSSGMNKGVAPKITNMVVAEGSKVITLYFNYNIDKLTTYFAGMSFNFSGTDIGHNLVGLSLTQNYLTYTLVTAPAAGQTITCTYDATVGDIFGRVYNIPLPNQTIVRSIPSESDSRITISGTGFGTKAIPAPIYFNDFEGYADGTDYTSANMDDLGDDHDITVSIDSSNPFSGNKSMLAKWYDIRGMFPKVGVYYPSRAANEMYVSYRSYHTVIVPFDNDYIYKFSRGGCSLDENGNFNPYGGWPHYYESYTVNKDTGRPGAADRGYIRDFADGYTPNTGVGSRAYPNEWNHIEHFFKMSSGDGSLNGTCINTTNLVDNDNYQNQETLLPKYAGRKLDFAMLFTGIPSVVGRLHQWIDNIYIDDTRQRVELGNRTPYTSCTERIAQPAISWSDTQITFTINKGVLSSGTNYAYVLDTNGNPVNAAGQAVTL